MAGHTGLVGLGHESSLWRGSHILSSACFSKASVAGAVLLNLAYALTGHTRGGPAHAADRGERSFRHNVPGPLPRHAIETADGQPSSI